MVHLAFDILAALSAFLMSAIVYRWRLSDAADKIAAAGTGYAIALVGGAVAGAYGAGTLNLWMSGVPGIGRSIIGALAGAIAAIELYKWHFGIKGSTGIVFVPAFATSIAIGRIGCFLSGLEDQTHGVATALPWAVDFGDGIPRHPVQLYESVAMALFLFIALICLARRASYFLSNGFYLMVGWYGFQRFAWEFLKPYGAIMGPFNVFHFVAFGLVLYGVVMVPRSTRGDGNR
jgi:phosphatidylglycerol---prolipoprotein diacylglyceryl transferase